MTESVAFAVSQFLELLDVGVGLQANEETSRIRQVLQWFEQRSSENHQNLNQEELSKLARGIRDVSYMFENQLEATDPDQADSRAGKCVPVPMRLRKRRSSSAGKVMLDIRNRLAFIRETYEQHLHRYSLSPPKDLTSRNLAYKQPRAFVRREKEMRILIPYLVPDNDLCQVVSISGVAGIGKTILAQQLFEDDQLRYEYPVRIWVHVSKKPRREIMEEIVRTFRGSVGVMSEEELGREICSHLERSRTFFVLDDIGSLDDFESLAIILPRTGDAITRCKILITTRSKQVADSAHSTAPGHRTAPRCVHLRRLTDDEGYQLLLKNVPDFMVDGIQGELGKKIVNFCGGLPMSILSFIRSMATKHTLEEWEETCFLYMGVLQEHQHIEVEKLYLMWLADKLISLKRLHQGKRLVDTVQNYVTELAHRNMIDLYHEGEARTITRFQYCQLSELMRDLSLLKNKHECFFKVVDFVRGSQLVPDSFSSSSECRIHRVAINFDECEEGCGLPLTDDEKTHVRVLLCSAKKKQVWPKELSSLAKFKYLRILDFNGFNFDLSILPEGIAAAVHLRYLSFRDCVLAELPSSIGNLKFLIILDLRVQDSTKMIIPDVLWKMRKLRHLYFPLMFETPDGGKIRLDGLTELETITNFNTWMFNVDDLLKMPKLQFLAANAAGNLEDIEYIIKRMTMNSNVETLETSLEIRDFDCYTEERHSVFRKVLACQSLKVLCIEGHLCRMPMHYKFSQNLTKIIFIGSELLEDPMRTVEKLPKLRVLVLDDAYVGKEMVCSSSNFLELKILELLNLHAIEKWIVEDGAMPKLSTLVLANCGRLEMLPEGLQSIRGLQELDVSRMSKDFQNRIRNVDPAMGQDTHKVQHVPSIVFDDK
ncbi:putative disease resistance RPP8-like protein 2 [Sesamum alatum]|uniref:Disease resistance RPP8-like protein 2 n=1 Tax=Sesamum alatum TaxID=300844 RepID=A0AAE1YCP9_9LAMI|nr:putative disease resistance RPP8-like protein 2 [Sesamum alatum]